MIYEGQTTWSRIEKVFHGTFLYVAKGVLEEYVLYLHQVKIRRHMVVVTNLGTSINLDVR